MRSCKTLAIIVHIAVVLSTAGCEGGEASRAPARAVTCEVCHGGRGFETLPMSPSLAGQDRAYIAKQLRAYKNGSRNDTIMSPFAVALSNREIDDLSAHFASLDPCALK